MSRERCYLRWLEQRHVFLPGLFAETMVTCK